MSTTVIDANTVFIAIRFATVLLGNMNFIQLFFCQKQFCYKYEKKVDDVITYILTSARHTNHF